MRDRGLVIVLSISYSNQDPNSLLGISDHIHYQYRVQRIFETEYETTETVYGWVGEEDSNEDETHRLIRKRFGILIKIIQTGSIARFSLQELLFHVMSGLGLLAIITTVVDTLALYLMPIHLKEKYWECKYTHYMVEDQENNANNQSHTSQKNKKNNNKNE
jgi:hypothetical protein